MVMNRLIAAVDPVLCDAYVCRMLNYQPEEVPYLSMAEALGVGSADLSRLSIRALNEPEQELTLPEERKSCGTSRMQWKKWSPAAHATGI